MRLLPAALWLAVISLTAGCSDAVSREEEALSADVVISFATNSADSISSRGVETNAQNMQEFAVSAQTVGSQGTSTYFAHEVYDYDYLGQSVSATQQGKTYYWKNNDCIYNFFAYTPSQDITFASGVIDRFQLNVESNVLYQRDIMVACVKNAAYGKKVPLKFTHPLAEVTFSIGVSDLQYVSAITLSGIVGKATFNISTGEWTYSKYDTKTFVMDIQDFKGSYSSLSGDDMKLFMIPQTLTSISKITIQFVDGFGLEHIHQKALTGTWRPGCRYNYTINILH